MKHSFLILLSLIVLSFSFCKKQDCTTPSDNVSPCLQAKFDAFKVLPYAEAIIKIQRPAGPLYWFVKIFADGREDVLDENCELVCITDCECIFTGPIYDCTGAELDFPRETIWHK